MLLLLPGTSNVSVIFIQLNILNPTIMNSQGKQKKILNSGSLKEPIKND